jgi:4-hydroxythreonine-4-phosphate dehydrogenase
LSNCTSIGITLGDLTGIGPEVALKAVADQMRAAPQTQYVLIGDAEAARRWNQRLGLNLPFQLCAGEIPRGPESFPSRQAATGLAQETDSVLVLDAAPQRLGSGLPAGSPEAALAAVAWVEEGVRRCLRGELDALVTSPVNKEAIVRAGRDFVGQTELLSHLASTPRTAMMLLGVDDRGRWLRVALATTHLPIKAVSEHLTLEKVALAIELAAKACHDLELPRARVAVCGLNPHAGEGGKMGTEEQTTIRPAVHAMRDRGIDVVGPLSADALFHHAYRGDYDAVVAMYHDQGLAPLKMVAFETGINWTLGLPFIRTSPDHGTAYDIAGQGKANPSSMVAAIRLARQLTAVRAKPKSGGE